MGNSYLSVVFVQYNRLHFFITADTWRCMIIVCRLGSKGRQEVCIGAAKLASFNHGGVNYNGCTNGNWGWLQVTDVQ